MGSILIESIRSAPFLEKAVRFVGDMDDTSSRREKPEPWLGKLLPNTTQKIGINFSESANSFVWDKSQIKDMAALLKLVNDCGIHDSVTGRHITDINLNYAGDPFLTHKDMRVTMENGKAVLDDSIPKNKILSAFFYADPRFKVVGDKTDKAFSAIHQFEIGYQADMERLEIQELEAEMNVTQLLTQMDRKKLLLLCRIWGHTPPKDTGENKIRALLYQEATKRSGYVGREKKTSWLNKFAGLSEAELTSWVIFLDARDARVITRTREDDQFEYQGLLFGKYEQDVVNFLNNSGNDQVISDIKKLIKKRKLKGGEEEVILIGKTGGRSGEDGPE